VQNIKYQTLTSYSSGLLASTSHKHDDHSSWLNNVKQHSILE